MRLEPREYTWDEIMQWDDPEWLIDGVLTRGACVFLSAQPKVGKSFWALRVAAAVTSGSMLFGHQARRGNVVYLAAERAQTVKTRGLALIQHGIPFDPKRFRAWPSAVMFADHQEVRDFAASLRVKPDLLIVDTLRRCNDKDESDNPHMTRWCKGVELFRNLTGSAVLVIHHDHRPSIDKFGRQVQTAFSGAGAILGSLDGYFTARPQGKNIIIEPVASNDLLEFRMVTSIETAFEEKGIKVGVMVEEAADEDKPDIWPMVREVLARNPGVNQTKLTALCKEDPMIAAWWPDLNKSTISRCLDEHEAEVTVDKDGRANRCSLRDEALAQAAD